LKAAGAFVSAYSYGMSLSHMCSSLGGITREKLIAAGLKEITTNTVTYWVGYECDELGLPVPVCIACASLVGVGVDTALTPVFVDGIDAYNFSNITDTQDTGAQVIHNVFPDEVQAGKTYSFYVEDGRIFLDNGINHADFVVDMDGNLFLGNGHSFLAGGQDVQAAGQMIINRDGYVRLITNQSGHYQPTVLNALNYPQILQNNGVNVRNSWIRIEMFDSTTSNYIIPRGIYYNGPIQYMPK